MLHPKPGTALPTLSLWQKKTQSLEVDEEQARASRIIRLDEFSVKRKTFDTTISDLEQRRARC